MIKVVLFVSTIGKQLFLLLNIFTIRKFQLRINMPRWTLKQRGWEGNNSPRSTYSLPTFRSKMAYYKCWPWFISSTAYISFELLTQIMKHGYSSYIKNILIAILYHIYNKTLSYNVIQFFPLMQIHPI